MTAALEGDEWSAARPGRTLPPGKTRYPFYRKNVEVVDVKPGGTYSNHWEEGSVKDCDTQCFENDT